MIFTPIIGAIGTGLAAIGSGSAIAGAAIVGGTVAAVSTVKSVRETKKAQQVQTQAVQTQVEMQRQEVARQRRSAIRSYLVRRARTRQEAIARGMEGSSAFQGIVAGASSQLGANIGFSNMMSGLGSQYTTLTGQANLFQSRANIASSIAGLGLTAAQYFGARVPTAKVPTDE